MFPASNWMGQSLQTALSEPPQLTLTFYSYGVLLRKPLADGTLTEYPVDPAHIAQALAAQVTFDTGLLDGTVLRVRQVGLKQILVGYRKPQITGVWLDGQGDPLRVPLPGLVVRQTRVEGRAETTHVWAVKRRPTTPTTPLYHAPLPNVFGNGSVCWGSVTQAVETGLSLAATWARLFGTAFGGHAVTGKSRRFREDIRVGLLTLAQASARTWPTPDLLPTDFTLSDLLDKETL